MTLDSRLRPRLVLIFAALLALAAPACTTASAGIVTSNIPLEGKEYTVLGSAETVKTWYSVDTGFIGLPLRPPPVDEAIADLLKQKGGNALVNIRYSTDRTILFFLVTRHRFILKADVVRVSGLGLPATPAAPATTP